MVVGSMNPAGEGRRGFRVLEEGACVSCHALFALFLTFNRTLGDMIKHLAIEECGGN